MEGPSLLWPPTLELPSQRGLLDPNLVAFSVVSLNITLKLGLSFPLVDVFSVMVILLGFLKIVFMMCDAVYSFYCKIGFMLFAALGAAFLQQKGGIEIKINVCD